MKFLLPILIFFTLEIQSQNLDKIRLMCLDEVNLSQYGGELSKQELQNQIATIGFRYIENGQIKYHNELIVYDCNTGHVAFTAVFDENRLVKEFVQYESEDVPAKKIIFTKKPSSNYVNLKLSYKGQEIPAYPTGEIEILKSGQLKYKIRVKQDGSAPIVSVYDVNNQKTAEGGAFISGNVRKEWSIDKIGEWKYFEGGQLASISSYDEKGIVSAEKIYKKGNLAKEIKFLATGTTELTLFYSDGNIKEKGREKEGAKVETWEYFTISGELEQKTEYIAGKEMMKQFYKGKNLVRELLLVEDEAELSSSLKGLNDVYKTISYYPNSEKKSVGYTNGVNKVGVFEYYDTEGNLNEIAEFNLDGNEINSLDAATYSSMKKIEKEVFRELLVAKTTQPANLNKLKDIKELTSLVSLNVDSLNLNADYLEDFETDYSSILQQTRFFGKLSNQLNWYDSLLAEAEDFTNRNWDYSKELVDQELELEKRYAKLQIQEKLTWLKENYTSTKKTLFGEKIVVLNDQYEIYEFISEEIYPAYVADIETARNKFEVEEKVYDFKLLMKRGSSLIAQPNEQFKKTLEKTESVGDKKKLFLTLK